jgi:uncharacterized membrane protein YidH (DUF202 family)
MSRCVLIRQVLGGIAYAKAPVSFRSSAGTREFGLVLISVGLLSILLGVYEHRRDLRALRKEYPNMPPSGTQLIAVLMATLGTLALVGVIYRF